MCVLLYRLVARAHLCIYILPLPATGVPLSSFWQIQVPYTKSQFQRLREKVHWAVQMQFHSHPFVQPPSTTSLSLSPIHLVS